MRPFRNADLAGPSLSTAAVAEFAAAASVNPPPHPGLAPGAANVSGTNYVFYTATDGTVQMKSLATGGQYASAGGHLVSAPAPVVTAVGHDGLGAFAVFGRGTDNALWYTTCVASGPTVSDGNGSWTSLGGVLTTGIGAFVYNPTPDTFTLAAYALGSDSQVWQHTGLAPGTWSKVTP
jgi:hypothetical protein